VKAKTFDSKFDAGESLGGNPACKSAVPARSSRPAAIVRTTNKKEGFMSRQREEESTQSRRSMLRKLGGVAASLGIGTSAFAQGLCRDGYGQGRCILSREVATAPIQPVFAPTGWTTSALEHITFELQDYRKEAAFYIALLGWKLRSDDGQQAILDIGTWGSAVFRQTAPGNFSVKVPEGRRAAVTGFAFVIGDWNAKRVAAALEKRGLHPVADNKGTFESFHVKDPDGWDLQICNDHGLASSRRRPAVATLSEPLPFASTGWKTVWLDHLSFRVTNYKESTSFYSNLMGWTPDYDEGSQNELLIGDVGDILVRGGNPLAPAPTPTPQRSALLDHISFGISPWDVDRVRAALELRGLKASVDTSSAHLGPDGRYVSDDIHQAAFQSYHTQTPNGFNLQISWMTKDKRLALATAVKPRALLATP
jgi:catechol 2,3-dioxygenase-like lactoylglutathione lyase family enzyme